MKLYAYFHRLIGLISVGKARLGYIMLCYVRLAYVKGAREFLWIFILSEMPKMRNREQKSLRTLVSYCSEIYENIFSEIIFGFITLLFIIQNICDK
jgi:hypothetical protein